VKVATGLDAVVFAPEVVASPGRWPAVGLSLSLPPGLHTLEVAVEGQALDEGLLSPTVARVGVASRPSAPGDLWSGEALRRGHRGWITHPVVVRVGEGLAGRVVVAVAAVVHRAPRGSLTLRVRVEDLGEAVGRVVFGGEAEAVGGPWVRYDAGEGAGVALAAWCDADAARRAVCEALGARGRVTMLDRGGRATCGPVCDAMWRLVLRALCRGSLRAVSITGDDEACGWWLGASLRGDARPVERCAWMPEAMPRALPAAVAAMPAALQWGHGTMAEPVWPRRVTAWEFARGVHALPVEPRWLGRYARGPFAEGWLATRGHYREVATVAPEAEAWMRDELLGGGGTVRRAA